MTSLILFIDNPEHASLEPALGAAIPADATQRIYEALLLRLQNLTGLFAGEKYLYYSHYPNWNDVWDINQYRKRIQIGESPAERINGAVEATAEESPEAILWTGIAAVSLAPADISAIESALSDTDVLIGESPAGEVILLGLAPGAYELALPETMNAGDLEQSATAAGLRVHRMPLPQSPQSPEDLRDLGISVEQPNS